MHVQKHPGRLSPTDVLERVFEGGIIIDPSDRLSVVPGLTLLEALIAHCALEQARREAA